ncbi:tyrosine-type recombinase/integrase [Stutzerimonas nitrititolerans]|uniref:tyrosine-type recombinase/integrase n=1 Tax=Stutzerimonas nitrititolerans TaxID=2482751 RepID=UPI0028AA3449|nr:tyrosine-type recombinase/integrase [Stutzerimonas nitrititolerans]
MADHIFQKEGESTWYCRLDVPKDVRSAFKGRRVWVQSLKTGLRSEAMQRRLSVLAGWKAQIAAARKLRAERGDAWLDEVGEDSRTIATITKGLISAAVTPSAANKTTAPFSPPIPEGSRGYVLDLHGKSLPEQIETIQGFAQFLRGLSADEIQQTYGLAGAEAEQLQTILLDPTAYKPKSPITPSRLDSFRTHLERKGTAAKTVDQVCRRVALFSSYLGKHGHPLTFDTVTAYLDQLTDKAGNPLTAKTKKQHVWSCSMYWKWACKYDADWREQYKGQPSPFADHDLPVIKGESAPWEAFTKEDVEKLHALALEKKDQPLADLIAVGAYTGARLEEIGRIHRDNITFKDGVPISFHIEQAKTTAGEREVPIHHKIAGLVQSLLDASPDGYLLPGGNNKYGNRLDPLSKRFGRLKTAAGFDKQFVFHSIRKTAITLVHQAGADVAVMPGLFGHETGMITFDLYSQGPSLEQKAKVIGLLCFDFP